MGLVKTLLWTLQAFNLYTVIEALEFVEYPTAGVRTGQKYAIRYKSNDSAVCKISCLHSNFPDCDSQPVSINLMRGAPQNIVVVSILGIASFSYFEWNVSQDLSEGDNYALTLTQYNTWAYSGFFNVTKDLNPSSSITTIPSTSSSQTLSSSATTTGEASTQLQPGVISTGMKVLIAVGSSIAGLVVLPMAFLLGRTRYTKPMQSLDTETGAGWVKPELEGKALYRHEYMAELEGSTGAQEMRTDADAKELTGALTHNRTELDAEPKVLEIDINSAQRSSDNSQEHSENDGHENRNTEGARNGTKEEARTASDNDSRSQPS